MRHDIRTDSYLNCKNKDLVVVRTVKKGFLMRAGSSCLS